MKFKINLCFCILCFCSSTFAQLKAYQDTTRIKDTVVREVFTVPEISAEFPGGASEISKYFLENFMNKLTTTQDDLVNFKSPAVRWTVDETGKVIDVKIIKSSNITSVDNLLIEVTSKMPQWKPAENNHKKVAQVFTIPMHICFK
jgi:TonB family protein